MHFHISLHTIVPLAVSKYKIVQIKAHERMIINVLFPKVVALIPYNNQRYLASASVDRFYKIWDLENTSSPQESVKKGIITDGVWMLHWPSAVIGFDDALGY